MICNNQKNFPKTQTCSRKCANILKKQKLYEERICVECQQQFVIRKKIEKKLCSDDCRKSWALKDENKNKRLQKSEDAIYKKYGVKTTLQLNTVKEKIKNTKKEKYGDENYNNNSKSKNTKKEKYGDENYNNNLKSKNTKKEKYGDENYNNRPKANSTSNERYGSEFPIQLEYFQNKRKETNLEKYNHEYPTQNKTIKIKTQETNQLRYGVPFQSQSEITKNKITKTWNDKIETTKSYTLYKSLDSVNIKLIGSFSGIVNSAYELNLPCYKEYKFECLNCNMVFQATFANYCLPTCRKCNPPNKSSKIQNIVRNFLKENNINYLENYRYAIKKLELDFFIPELKIAIEVNGNYFHSERAGGKNKNYHINKTLLCEKENIKLIHIFEDELLLKKDIVLSKLNHILNLTPKLNTIFARKCNINLISNSIKKDFLDQNHLQGNCVSKINLGLFYNQKLYSIATFSKNRISLGGKTTENDWELTRFCNLLNHNIPGGFSKLLKYFILNYNPKTLISYCEIRYSGIKNENNMYIKNGFQLSKITKPGYWYFTKGNYINRNHRFKFRKNIIKKLAISQNINTENLTEWEISQNLNMDRIWDCGQLKYYIIF